MGGSAPSSEEVGRRAIRRAKKWLGNAWHLKMRHTAMRETSSQKSTEQQRGRRVVRHAPNGREDNEQHGGHREAKTVAHREEDAGWERVRVEGDEWSGGHRTARRVTSCQKCIEWRHGRQKPVEPQVTVRTLNSHELQDGYHGDEQPRGCRAARSLSEWEDTDQRGRELNGKESAK